MKGLKMADKELQNILNSGEITTIFTNSQDAQDRHLSKGEIEALQVITDLQALTKYESNTATNITVASDIYETILTLDVTNMVAIGEYELRMSMLYSLDNTTTSAYFRFSIDNGLTWTEVSKEPKDTTDLIPMNYWKVITGISGTMNVIMQARKENAAVTLFIQEVDASLSRKA